MEEDNKITTTDEYYEMIKDSFARLEEREKVLTEEAGKIEDELDSIIKEKAQMAIILETAKKLKGYEEAKNKPKRITGIKKAVLKVASSGHGGEWCESAMVAMVQNELPDASVKSIQGAYQTLVRNGVFVKVGGEKGNWVFGFANKVKIAPPETTTETAAEGSFELTGGKTIEQVIDVLAKNIKINPKGIVVSESKVAWMADEWHTDPKHINNAMKLMVKDGYEFAYEHGKKILRKIAEPGSKEELQRMQVEHNPLFPKADPPKY